MSARRRERRDNVTVRRVVVLRWLLRLTQQNAGDAERGVLTQQQRDRYTIRAALLADMALAFARGDES